MAKLARSQFVCQSCGHVEPRWLGRCPDCGAWSSLHEQTPVRAGSGWPAGALGTASPPQLLRAVATDPVPRLRTEIGELDRVLGGGLVPGSLVLLGGDPGVGKSTLLLQALDGVARAGRRVLYVSGEESVQQTAL